MQGYWVEIFLNHSITIVAAIAVCRCRSTHKNYHPFLILVWLGFINETLSLFLILSNKSNAANSNIYVLVECILILTQFLLWRGINVFMYYLLLTTVVLVWMADNLLVHSLKGNNSWFRIYYSFVVMLVTIVQITRIIKQERFSIIKNPVFIISFAFLMYFSCKAFVEIFNAFSLGFGNSFNLQMFRLLDIVGFLSNIFFAIAIICIPRKQQFIMPY